MQSSPSLRTNRAPSPQHASSSSGGRLIGAATSPRVGVRRQLDLEERLLPTEQFTPPPQPVVGDTWLVMQTKAILYGVINTIVVTPVMVGFAAIIFRHHAFHEDPAVYAQLVKLVLFSSAVHQTAFTACSSLPFAIGQVHRAPPPRSRTKSDTHRDSRIFLSLSLSLALSSASARHVRRCKTPA